MAESESVGLHDIAAYRENAGIIRDSTRINGSSACIDSNISGDNTNDCACEEATDITDDNSRSIADFKPFQLISAEKEFQKDCIHYLRDAGFAKLGLDYHVVSVFGAQSTGKSTLLNQLFGTQFPTMGDINRQQTTRGIWLSTAKNRPILVMDVEGLDGRERGEDQDFERKGALFSLTTSEVLIVNMWEHQIGLYQGANLALLKTVFEVNLGLLAANPSWKARSLLLFVVRDFIGNTPLRNLENIVRNDLNRIWNDLKKPELLKDSTFEMFFELQFFGLAHRILVREKFDEDVTHLAKWFYDSDCANYVFRPEFHRMVPADGFPIFAESCWSQIEANKDLDVPKQRELLAQYRCDEISREAMQIFQENIESVEKEVKLEVLLDDLGRQMHNARQAALSHYEHEGKRYDVKIYEQKKKTFLTNIDGRLQLLFVKQLAALHKRCILTFNQYMKEFSAANDSFSAYWQRGMKEQEQFFCQMADSCIGSDSKWEYTDELDKLKAELKSAVAKYRAEELKKICKRSARKISRIWKEVHNLLMMAKPTMWDDVLDLLGHNTTGVIKGFESETESYSCSSEEVSEFVQQLRKEIWHQFHANINKELTVSGILLCLQERFESDFKYDAAGVPRDWTEAQSLSKDYARAYQRTLDVIPLFSQMQRHDGKPIEVFDDPDQDDADCAHESLTILNLEMQEDIKLKFKRLCENIYVDARRSMSSQRTKVPSWAYLVMLILGWNEFMAILRNPFMFMALLMLGALLYLIYAANLWNPVLRVMYAFYDQFVLIAKEKLCSMVQDMPQGYSVSTPKFDGQMPEMEVIKNGEQSQ